MFHNVWDPFVCLLVCYVFNFWGLEIKIAPDAKYELKSGGYWEMRAHWTWKNCLRNWHLHPSHTVWTSWLRGAAYQTLTFPQAFLLKKYLLNSYSDLGKKSISHCCFSPFPVMLYSTSPAGYPSGFTFLPVCLENSSLCSIACKRQISITNMKRVVPKITQFYLKRAIQYP